MKIILDSCIWGKAKDELIHLGFDTVWAGDWTSDPGDDIILQKAYSESRILITLDKDFGELAVLKKQNHCGIVRLVNISALQQAKITSYILKKYPEELLGKAIITVDSEKVRIRF